MKKITAIGEALIDFIPSKRNCALKEVPSFSRMCGGAPANVAAAAAKLGGKVDFITQLGNDSFGDYIVDTLSDSGVDTSLILRTDKANTALAFVSLKSDGSRDFSFYRKPSADMLLEPDSIKENVVANIDMLHFGSVDLIECPMKETHIKLLENCRRAGKLISFDPNIRLPLWNSPEKCKETVNEFIEYADVLKISDEEIEFITGKTNIYTAFDEFFAKGVKVILYSMGKEGSKIITGNYEINVPNIDVEVCDTTGAGDAIMGSFLYQLALNDADKKNITEFTEEKMTEMLTFANFYSNYSVTAHGAITSYPDAETFKKFIEELR